ncbi:hypothetical protein POSPLADRAFT_1148222 [Postia placenta MAD-698-R-SB12]|uniref:Uncharacterized protein n=1 Tax=Postia placenta MAD-698-R-SB12 TaxID=670580 RepID=A0A1X6MWQ4_9APHY|nr:hypothetical protein POSPLADRAFT_1148222 [Postia placenta MAD-698-R-SB12]OSX60672.1 hypothetical protein POSPLADRAFT_1148222 [Postia placenta MAD-698-R-SB12]
MLAVTALRAFAVSGRNWYIVAFMWLLGLVPTAINFVRPLRPGIVSRLSFLLPDIMAVGVTWFYIQRGKSAKLRSICNFWTVRPDILTVTLHDGEPFMSFLNLINSLIWLSLEGTLYFLMSSILISRFLLHIREAADCASNTDAMQSYVCTESESDRHTWLSTTDFALHSSDDTGDVDVDEHPGFDSVPRDGVGGSHRNVDMGLDVSIGIDRQAY